MNPFATQLVERNAPLNRTGHWGAAAGMLLMLVVVFCWVPALQAAEDNQTDAKTVQQEGGNVTDSKTASATDAQKSDADASQNRILTGQRGLVGREVRNLDNEAIGEVENILVDADGSRIQAVVSVGGFWGIGDEELIVPLDKFRLNQRRDYVFFDGTESELKAFPEYQAPVWGRGRYDSAYRGRMYYGPPAMYTYDPYYDGDRRTMQRMHPRDRGNRYDSGWNHYEDMVPRYGMRGYYHDGTMGSRAYPNDGRRTYGERYDGRWDENGGRRANDNARRGDAEQQDRWYGNRRTDFKYDQNQNRLKASDLIGMSVKNARGETIGEVDDILVASNGRMDLLISVGEFLGMGGKQIRADLKDVELDDPDFVFYDISNREMENQPAYQADER